MYAWIQCKHRYDIDMDEGINTIKKMKWCRLAYDDIANDEHRNKGNIKRKKKNDCGIKKN